MPGGATFTVGKLPMGSPPAADGTYPSVTIEDDEVTIGEKWEDSAGQTKAGSDEAVVEFDYRDKHFKVRLSTFTEEALKNPQEHVEGLLEKMKKVLMQPPATREGGLFVWGKEISGTVRGIVDKDDKVVPFEMFIPAGAFGIYAEHNIARREEYQGWFDTWVTAYTILYVGETGQKPTLPPPTGLPTTAATAAWKRWFDVLAGLTRVIGMLIRI